MERNQQFSLSKYLGTWYELLHYPSWFQRNDNYNTKAKYSLMKDGRIRVHNSTIVAGQKINSYGIATQLEGNQLQVEFSPEEIQKLIGSAQFGPPSTPPMMIRPNYVIDALWCNSEGEYIYAVVTDAAKSSLYLLSRFPHPTLESYNRVMKYILANYDRDRLVQTPHFAH